jgi:hypothetical protein
MKTLFCDFGSRSTQCRSLPVVSFLSSTSWGVSILTGTPGHKDDSIACPPSRADLRLRDWTRQQSTA